MNSELNFEGFVPIHTIFYTIFHPTQGSKVCYQFPNNSLQDSNINFDSIKNFIIPKPQLCHRLLTIKYGNYRIASYPVAVNSSSYARNYFRFNFVFVFQYNCETSPYEAAITRLGKLFRSLEEQKQILSNAESDTSLFKSDNLNENQFNNNKNSITNTITATTTTKKKINKISVQDILMRLYQDLNNYSECFIPIDDGIAIDIKIFPILKKPEFVNITIEDVPMLIVNISKIVDSNWDPTMISILPFINGFNSIMMISKLSDCDPDLVIECIKHLIYYKCIILTDIFSFDNIYAPTSLIKQFLIDPILAHDCQNYVLLPKSSVLNNLPFFINNTINTNTNNNTTSTTTNNNNYSHQKSRSISSSCKTNSSSIVDDTFSTNNDSLMFYSNSQKIRSASTISSDGLNSNSNKFDQQKPYFYPTKSTLFDLYRSLSQGITLENWYMENFNTIKDNHIDIRKFIQFGIIKKLIYKLKSYPIMQKRDVILRESLTNKLTQVEKYRQSNAFLSTSDIKFDIGDKLLNSIYKKLSKVSFERQNFNNNSILNKKITNKEKIIDPLILNHDEKLLLLKSLEKIESFDRICVKLGKSRIEVQQLVNDIGDYKVINA